ncbi:MAG: hypothetical protein EAZ91_17570 [Cytophagales bacterium]|nr:MAG: hypothetical protein EAZ91_17570 [Cytophagales bacterium]
MDKNYSFLGRLLAHFGSVSTGCLLLLMTLFSFSAQAQITGKVYRDFNANGTQDTPISSTASATGEPGFPGIVVMAYPATGSPVSVTTGIDGSYSFPNSGATASGAKLRLEFSGLPSGVYSAAYGTATTGSGTSVQFVTAGGTAVANYGIHYPGEYCDSSPQLATPCFVSGTQSAASVANEHVLVTFPYSAQSTNSGTLANPVASNTVNPTPIADAGHVGSVWGMAYQRESNKLFTTALLKRHVGLGSGGLGGIYSTSNATGSTVNGSLYVDLEAAPFSLDLGQSLLGTRTLPATPTASSTDPNAFSLIGVVGLGGLAISDDGTKLYTVDLYNKKLLILNIGTPAKASPSADDLTQVLIPTPSCTNGVARPFGVSVYHEKVYVGVVCTAESASGVAANLTMSVFEMDGATQTFNPTAVLNAPLNYPKGYVHAQQIALGDRWEPWTSSFSTMNTTQLTASPLVFRTAQPQPILSDIDFTDNGDMVLTLMDRAGHQLGYRQASPAGGTTLYSGYIGGDLLRARKQGTTWVLESAGRVSSSTSGTLTGGSTNNAQGPGSGEFYSNDNYVGDNDANGVADEIHQETSQGGSVIVRGTNQTVTIHMDPMATWSGGTIWHNNTTGLRSKVYQLYRTIDNSGSQVNGTYGKANGLGLPVALCDPAPVEIGNRIWLDTNKDGIQDPAETPIASVSVGLYNSGTLVATAVTNAKGEYYFSSAPGTSSTAVRYNLALIRGGAYELRILRTQPALANFETLSPTDANTNGTDAIDNDFALSGSNLVTSLTVGMSGNNLHLFDAGVTPVPPCSLTLAALPGACDPLTNTYALSGTITLTSNNTAGTATVTDGARSTTVSVPSGATSVVWSLTGFASNGANHTAIVTLTNCGTASTTYAAPASCTACSLSITTTSLPDGQVGAVYSQSIAATGGTGSLTYTVSGGSLPTGLNLGASTGVIAGTPTVAATSSFAVKVTDTKGCTAVVPLTIMTSALPVCSLTLSAIPGPCVPATNTYAITGTISLTNNTAGGTAIITDGSATTTVVIAPNATSANFTLSGLLSNGTTHLVSVSLTGCGISSTTYSAPVSCSAAPLKASLGDYVWLDTNKNGQQDGAESGVPSVTVVLCDATSGSAISTTLTDSQGKYLFSNLDPGSYTVKFTAPDGTTFTTPNSGT